MENQLSDLRDNLFRKFGTLESIPHLILGQVKNLSIDIVLGDPVSTVTTDGTIEVFYCPRFGISFENCVSALRA